MITLSRSRTALAMIASAILLAPFVCPAQDLSDADAREISDYNLTEAALAKYIQATHNLDAIPNSAAKCDDEGEADSLDAIVARITGTPGAQAAVEAAGMTAREYVVFTWSILQNGMAAWALTQPGGTLPPGVSKANVDFYNAHQDAFAQLAAREGAESCSEDDESGYEEEYAEPDSMD